MRRGTRSRLRMVAVVLLALSVSACTASSTPPTATSSSTASTTPSGPPAAEPATLVSAADAVLRDIRDEDYESLAARVDRGHGVRFTPYAYVDLTKDVVIPADQVAGLGEDPAVRTWGTYAGSGQPIELTFAQYRTQFVWDEDFLKADRVSPNVSIGSGSTLNNLTQAYPGDGFVEYHFEGFDPEYEGLDWVSLRVVLTPAAGRWALVGIVHDEWTP